MGMGKDTPPDPDTLRFGKLIKDLRRVRKITQEQLAELSGVSADGVRRIEQAKVSPSLRTIVKVARGLDLSLSTIFSAHDLNELDIDREVVMYARRRMSQRERLVALRILGYLVMILRELSRNDG